MAGRPWHRPSPGARAAPAGERSDSPARAHASQWCEGEWARARPPLARPRSQRTGWGGLRRAGGDSSEAQRGEGGGAGARGVACEGGRGWCVCEVCVCLCGGVVRPSEARRWHPRTRADSRRGRARTLLLSSAAPCGRPPCARPRKLFRAGASAGARLFLRHARAPAVPFRGALGLRVGRVWKGFCFPCSPHFPHFVVAIGVRRRKESRTARLGVPEKLARQPRALPFHSPRAHSRRPHSLKFPPLRFAFALKMAPESLHVRPRMFQSPSLSPPHPPLLPSQSLGISSVDPRHHLGFLSIPEHSRPSSKLAGVPTPVPWGPHPAHSGVS